MAPGLKVDDMGPPGSRRSEAESLPLLYGLSGESGSHDESVEEANDGIHVLRPSGGCLSNLFVINS